MRLIENWKVKFFFFSHKSIDVDTEVVLGVRYYCYCALGGKNEGGTKRASVFIFYHISFGFGGMFLISKKLFVFIALKQVRIVQGSHSI